MLATLFRAKMNLQSGVVLTGTKENAMKLAEILDVKPQSLLRSVFAAADKKQWFLPHTLAPAVREFRDLMNSGVVTIYKADMFIDHAEKGTNPRGTIYAHAYARVRGNLAEQAQENCSDKVPAVSKAVLAPTGNA